MHSGSYALIFKAGPVNATTRHNIIRNEISEICQVDGAPASKERSPDRLLGPRNETNNGDIDEESAERPVDVMIENWLFGEAAFVNVSVCDAHEHQSMRSS